MCLFKIEQNPTRYANKKMELPDDVLQIIKDYAQPQTRPDWRTLHIMPSTIFHLAAMERFSNYLYNIVIDIRGSYKKSVCFRYTVFNEDFYYTT